VVYTGQSVKRFEDPRLLTGQGTFLDDIKLPGMLHAAVLRSPHAHAHITSIATAAARHVPGVVSVFTAAELAGVVEPVPTRRETEAEDLRPPVHPVLARDKVCYVGQPIAIVVAQDLAQAQDARTLIQVDSAPLSPVIDPVEAMQVAAPIVHQELGTNIALRTHNAGGDVEAAFAQAAHVVRQRYRVQRLAPAPLETRGIMAHYQARPAGADCSRPGRVFPHVHAHGAPPHQPSPRRAVHTKPRPYTSRCGVSSPISRRPGLTGALAVLRRPFAWSVP
jgi:aerobic carbon-monoxide dehydrogenase large subunit